MSFERKEIEVVKLLLDLENPRYDATLNQRQAFQAIVSDQGRKIFNLAKDIIENDIDPASLIIVMEDEKKKNRFIVLEGNRRLVALKLMMSPSIMEEMMMTANLRKDMKKAGEEYSKKGPLDKILCAVAPTREDADKWIKLRHTGENKGVGVVRWDASQVARFDARFGIPRFHQQALNYLLANGAIDEETAGKVTTSNLNRLLDDPWVRGKLGFSVENKVLKTEQPLEEVIKGLKRIVSDLASRVVNVNDIRHKEDRRKYLDTFGPADLPDKSKIAAAPTYLATEPKASGPPTPKIKPPAQKRTTLIPKNCVIEVDPTRINDIFNELRGLQINRYTNAAAVLFRVFIETSLDYFIKENSIPLGPKKPILIRKLHKVTDHFESNGIMSKSELKPVRVAISQPDSIIAIDTFHAYVHNAAFTPSARELKVNWDRFQLFFERIWA